MTGTVLHALGSARPGGAEQFFDRLLPALANRDVPQIAAVRRHRERVARLTAAGIPTTGLPFANVRDPVTRHLIARLARRHDVRLYLGWMSRAAALAPTFGDEVVVAARLGGYYKLKYFGRCRVMVANTRGLADYIVAGGWPARDVWTLPNFVTPVHAAPVPREALGVRPDQPLVLALGRLHRDKGFDTLIDAMTELPRDTVCLIGGIGPERARLEAQVRASGLTGRVRFLGWRRDVPALMAAADVFVCSSRLEPLGNIVIEAWAERVPVVAVASPGPREIVEDRKTGLLTPLEDPAALARAIAHVLASPALAGDLVEAGYERVVADFSEARVSDAYLDFFERVIPACAA